MEVGIIRNKMRWFLFLLIGIFLFGFGSAALTNVTLLNDSFETVTANWTTDWDIETGQFVSAPSSIGCGRTDNDLISVNLDMSDATAIYIDFSYRIDDIDGNDNVVLYYYDGAAYNLIDEIGDDAEDSWLTYSAVVTDAQYFGSAFRIYIEGSKIDVNELLWVDDLTIVKTYDLNNVPVIANISASYSVIQGGDTITIYGNTSSNGVNDSDVDSLFFYCDSGDTPTAANTDCTGGITSDASYEYDFTCTFSVPVDDVSHVEYCRVYDGTAYSSAVNLTYTSDSTAPVVSVTSVAGDNVASYYDTADDSVTEINVSGEAGMVCRWSSSDVAYSSMSNDCAIGGATANCSVNNVASQGFHTRYISCMDQYDNEQNSSNNLAVGFYLDYTAPTTSDNSNSNIQSPPYVVTITEQDNVDSDPTTLYCIDTIGTCTPSLSIDDGGQMTFTTANRGINYLRYNSTDDAGNIEAIVNKTININRLPTFTSAVDNVTTIQGGASVNVSSVSVDVDGQQVTMWVCDSTNVTFEGCGGVEYCNVSEAANVSCAFASESDSASHTWYAYLFDDSDEGASNNPLSGSYVTDSAGPGITISSPLNGTYTNDDVTVSVVLDEAGSLAWYNLDGSVSNVSMNNISSL